MRWPELEDVLPVVGLARPANEFESERLDFKAPARSPKETFAILADASVCLVNGDGGLLVLGVDDKATTRVGALVGADPVDYAINAIRRGIFDRTRPALTVYAEEHLVDGARLVVIQVPQGIAFHSNSAGLATRRIGTECRPFTPDQQREVRISRGEIDWSAGVSGQSASELPPGPINRLRRLLDAAGSGDLAQLTDRRLLEALRLTDRTGKVTNAGLVLLGGEEQLRVAIPTYGYSYQYRPSAGREAINRIRGMKPAIEAIDLLLEAVALRTELKPLNVRGGQQLQIVDYPPNAVRELLVNAFIHRSYEAPGSVDVEQSPEHLIIASPGPLVAGVTPANILVHSSTPRNLLLAEVVSRIQLAERTGQGIDRAYREMLRLGKQPPQFTSDEDVRAALRGGVGNESFVRFVGDLPESLATDVEVLLALSALRTKPTLDAARLAELTQRPATEALEVLRRLEDDSVAVLEPTRRTSRSRFPTFRLRSRHLAQLGRAVAYGIRGADDIDTKVADHVREFGYITNASLQRLFDLHVFAARDLLTDFRSRGLLTKLGEARGGKGVRYGPGPNFPDRPR